MAKGIGAPATRQNQRLEVMLRSGLAVARYCLGRWDGLRDEVVRLLSEVSDYATSRIDLELVAGCLATAHGEADDALAWLRRVTEAAVEIGAYEVVPLAAGSWTRATLALGDVEGALTCVRSLVDVLDAKGVWASAGWAVPVTVEALVDAGRLTEASQFADRAERELRDLDTPLAGAATRSARGVLAAAGGDVRAAADDFRAAAQRYDALPAPYEAARAYERAAGCQLDHDPDGDRGAAALREAAAIYRRLGATWDYARAASLARRHGVGLPARHRGGRRGYGTALSPREREVASLAARGRANKQIAQELFTTASTVEKHLVAAMRKLRVRSRTELAHWLAEAGSKDSGFPSRPARARPWS
ncbi:MAG: hypothetical protein GEV12_21985 [Micromonosporaceae bacterium]|nr:hypothetical protein [Micromonosporaceae bacterium]